MTHAPQPVTIYIAVIEWPDGLVVSPDLIAARSHAECMTQTQATLAEVLGATVPEVMPDFRAAFERSPADFADAVVDTDDSPIITFYERTI